MTLRTPGVLWAIPLVGALVTLSLLIRARRARRLEAYLFGEPAGRFWPASPRAGTGMRYWVVQGTLLLVSASALLTALAGLEMGSREVQPRQDRAPLMLLVDVSRSMEVEDVPWGRLGTLRLTVRRLAARLPETDIGLTVFSETTHPLLPPGTDLDLLFNYLDAVETDMLSQPGTGLDQLLGECARLAGETESGMAESRDTPIFLLLSDGEDTSEAEELIRAANDIRRAGGLLATISFGSVEGGPVPGPNNLLPTLPQASSASPSSWPGTPYSKANPDLLRRLAQEGGGAFASSQNPAEMEGLLSWLEMALGQSQGAAPAVEGLDRWLWLVGLAALALLWESSIPNPLQRPSGASARSLAQDLGARS